MPHARRILLPLLAAAALGAATHAHAQFGPETGARVRVLAPLVAPERLTGTVVAASADSLALGVADGSATLRLDKHTLESLEVSRGRARLKWGLLGAGVGLLAGAIVGAELGGQDDPSGFGALAGFLGGAVVGLPAGAVGGALLAPERWDAYPLPRREP